MSDDISQEAWQGMVEILAKEADAWVAEDGENAELEYCLAALLADKQVGLLATEQEGFEVFAVCNDIFAWALADLVIVPYNSLIDLYQHWRKDSDFGVAVWCIKKRKVMPQRPVAQAIQEQGIWDLGSMGLSPNPYEAPLGTNYERKSNL